MRDYIKYSKLPAQDEMESADSILSGTCFKTAEFFTFITGYD